MPEIEPEAFGRYYLIDKIATGGMAEIFRAKSWSHGGFEQTLVIKRILKHLGESEEFVEMFIDEAKVSVALTHANIIRIYDFGKILDNYFIAMEWVDGKDVRNVLRKLTKSDRYLPPKLAALIAYEACRGLHFAHTKTDLHGEPLHIVHRDVSPSNLLISYDGEVKVADFGIAKAKSNAGTTDVGVIKGKFEYMSPEQAEGGVVDHRADLFALGVVFWEMLAGRRLLKGPTEIETLARVRNPQIPEPSSLNPMIDPELDRIALRALTKDPADRYPTAEAFAEDLRCAMLPESPDALRARLAEFMRDLFLEEIEQERRALAASTEAAVRLRRGAPDPAEAGYGTVPTVSRTLAPPRRSVFGWLVTALVVVGVSIGGLVVGAGGVGAIVAFWPAPTPPPKAPAVELGTLDVLLLPGGAITVDGRPVGDGEATVPLPAGSHTIDVVLDGYEPLHEEIHVRRGETLRWKRTLAPTPRVATPHPPRPAPPTPEVPANAPAPTAPEPPAAGAGRLIVSIQGGGWAELWIDGVRHDKNAPASVSVSAGRHDIRLVNESVGLDQRDQVDVPADGTFRVVGRPP